MATPVEPWLSGLGRTGVNSLENSKYLKLMISYLENRRKMEPKEIPSCLILCLLIVFT